MLAAGQTSAFIRRWEPDYAYFLFLSDPLPAFSVPLGVTGNYISQTPVLSGWDERRKKPGVSSHLPLLTMVSLSVAWYPLWLQFPSDSPSLNCSGYFPAAPGTILAATCRPGFWTHRPISSIVPPALR